MTTRKLYQRTMRAIVHLNVIYIKFFDSLLMVEAARAEAQKLLDTDPTLANYPLISARLSSKKTTVHFE